ncbi:hypothetical protein KIN20_013613, partial [Parelaphostrongylus tenuis]
MAIGLCSKYEPQCLIPRTPYLKMIQWCYTMKKALRYPSRPPTSSLCPCVEIRSSQFGPNTAVPPSCSQSSGRLVLENVPPVSSYGGFSE